MNFTDDLDLPPVTFNDVADTPAISGVLTAEDRAERARIRAHLIATDPWMTADLLDAEPPF